MANRNKRNRDPKKRKAGETHLEWENRLAAEKQGEAEHGDLVNEFASQHGDYADNGDRSRLNLGGSPLIRWRANKMLEPTQEAGIAYCMRLWDLLAQEPRITANYGENVKGVASHYESGAMILARMEAQEDLERICGRRDEFGVLVKKGYIPAPYWTVFENCIRNDEPTGISGSRCGSPTQTAKTRAHTVVVVVADTICWKEGLSAENPH